MAKRGRKPRATTLPAKADKGAVLNPATEVGNAIEKKLQAIDENLLRTLKNSAKKLKISNAMDFKAAVEARNILIYGRSQIEAHAGGGHSGNTNIQLVFYKDQEPKIIEATEASK